MRVRVSGFVYRWFVWLAFQNDPDDKMPSDWVDTSMTDDPEDKIDDWVGKQCAVECDDSCPRIPDASTVYECGGWQDINRKIVFLPDECGVQCPVPHARRNELSIMLCLSGQAGPSAPPTEGGIR